MLHVVCACGSLVTGTSGAAGGDPTCRSCHRPVPFPRAAILEAAGHVPASKTMAGPASHPPAAPPGPPSADASPAAAPGFGYDLRLDLPALDRQARQAGALGRLSLWSAVLGAAAVLALLPAPAVARVLCTVGMLLGGCLLWGAFRAARVAALAAIALAERHRELAHRVVR